MVTIQSRLDKTQKPTVIKGRFLIAAFVDDIDKAKDEIHALLSAWGRAIKVVVEFEEVDGDAD